MWKWRKKSGELSQWKGEPCVQEVTDSPIVDVARCPVPRKSIGKVLLRLALETGSSLLKENSTCVTIVDSPPALCVLFRHRCAV